MSDGPEKRLFQTTNLFSVTARNILSYGLGKFIGPYVLILFTQQYIFTTALHKNKSNTVRGRN